MGRRRADISDENLADDATDFDPSSFEDEPTIQINEPVEVKSIDPSSITTAASLASDTDKEVAKEEREPVDPNLFALQRFTSSLTLVVLELLA